MPRAGGSYIYASRGLNPYLGFVASFSQWFGLSIVIGVIAYITVPFMRDVCLNLGWSNVAASLEVGWIRVCLALLLIWIFVIINIQGTRSYERTLIPMMFLMFGLGTIVIVSGFSFDHSDFISALANNDGRELLLSEGSQRDWKTILSAAALLFASFIGFDSIAQAGGEARNPGKSLPRAIILAITIVGTFYFLFTAAVYHTVPWRFVATEAMYKDITAPGLLSYVLPTGLGAAIIAGAAIALINDLPAMLLSVSRLMFAWASDGIFPNSISKIHPTRHTPYLALISAGGMASIGVFGSHFAGDFFLGIDIMVTSMMINFLLMCITLLTIQNVNPQLAGEITMLKNRTLQKALGLSGVIILIIFLVLHTHKDLTANASAWYFRSSPIWLIVMGLASFIFIYKWRQLKASNIDIVKRFKHLPTE
jgi:amino acid transporter